jgi:hypothetical protein
MRESLSLRAARPWPGALSQVSVVAATVARRADDAFIRLSKDRDALFAALSG